MTSFDEIDKKLAAIGKDRAWLAQNTPYSADYIRTVLAPNSKRRTNRVMCILLAAIQKAEEQQKSNALPTEPPPDHITLTPSENQYRAWSAAQKFSDCVTLKDWAIESLDEAAKQWTELKVAEDPTPYRATPRLPHAGNG